MCCTRLIRRFKLRRAWGGRAAEQRDEVAPSYLIELHSVPAANRIAGYRIGRDQSADIRFDSGRLLADFSPSGAM